MMIEKTEHYLSVGILAKDTVKSEKQVGAAYYLPHQQKPYFQLNFWQYAGQPYYVVKNRSNANYTIFSKMIEDENSIPIFQCPVGYGYTNEDIRDVLQLQFNFPWQKCFLGLHPENKKETNYGTIA